MKRYKIVGLTVALLTCLALPAMADSNAPDTANDLFESSAKAASASGPLDPGAGVTAVDRGTFKVNGRKYRLHEDGRVHAGTMVPDGAGGYLWFGSEKPVQSPSKEVLGARELRLQIRELAAQLFSERQKGELAGSVAMPASFVNQDNFQSSSSFGRYIAEQMFYEINQLGIQVREYRTMPRILTRPEDGEFSLTRNMEEASPIPPEGLVLTGTYYYDKHNVFVNARLVRPRDGMVLRTANLVFPQTPVTMTMLRRGTGIRLQTAETELKDLTRMKDEVSLEFMLEQADIH